RNRLEAGHALKLALKGALAFKRTAMHNFDRAQCTRQTPRQPNLAIRTATDHAQNLVIGNYRYLRGSRTLRRAVFHFLSNGPTLAETAVERQSQRQRRVPIPGSARASRAGDRAPRSRTF